MIKRLLVASGVVLSLSGCATPITVPLTEKFDSSEAAEMLKLGNNTIKGSALIRQNGGGVVTCAGLPVNLIPATSYARQRLAVLYGNHTKAYRSARGIPQYIFQPDPADFGKYMRETTCNAQGYFTFDSVADGDFLVVNGISWVVAGEVQGGYMLQRVTVGGGETKEVVLSP